MVATPMVMARRGTLASPEKSEAASTRVTLHGRRGEERKHGCKNTGNPQPNKSEAAAKRVTLQAGQ